jgi:dihydroorotate dehydrogenase
MRTVILTLYAFLYENIIRRLIFRSSAHDAHRQMLRLLAFFDRSPLFDNLLAAAHRLVFPSHERSVGGVRLSNPLILAAGLVKGEGFETEEKAAAAVARGENIIPGWRAMPRLVGPVEFGSFTRHPRLGNPGVVVWRDETTRSTQNRVGLRNPGVKAAAAFLARHRHHLPPYFGINIAVSPGVTELNRQEIEITESFRAFLGQNIRPTWFTLNLSCPNTEDDPGSRQTEEQTRRLCRAARDAIGTDNVPLWVKISPELAHEQYRVLLRVFYETGIQAVIATNTLPRPAPDDPALTAGVGGGKLHAAALEAVRLLAQEKALHHYAVDIIGCGGILDGCSYRQFCAAGADAVQYWSALVYRGPLAAALIESELQHGNA